MKKISIKKFAVKTGRSVGSVRGWLDKGLLERKWRLGKLYFTEDDLKIAEQIKKEMNNKKNKGMNWKK